MRRNVEESKYPEIENQKESKTFLILGRTQHGKSTLIKFFCGLSDSEIKIGEGNGESCTSKVQYHKAKSGSPFSGHNLIDTIGTGENRYRISSLEMRQQMEDYIIEYTTKNELAGIIIVESVAESANSIRDNLENVRKIFGVLPEESILVLLTKKNMVADEEIYAAKKAKIQEALREKNIPTSRLMSCLAPCREFSNYNFEADIPLVKKELAKLKPIPLETIKKKREAIQERALKIQSSDLITDLRERDVPKVITKQVPVTRKVPKEVKRWDGELGKWFGRKKSKIIYVDETVMEDRQEIQLEKKTEKIFVKKPFEDCYQQALREFKQNKLKF